MNQAHEKTAGPKHGSKAHRINSHAEYFGPQWFELGTDFSRIFAQSMTALAHLTPIDRATLEATKAMRMRMDLFEGEPEPTDGHRSGHVMLRDLSPEQCATLAPGETKALAIWPTDVMGTPLVHKERYEHELEQWALVVPTQLHAELHSNTDPYWWTDACVGAVYAAALLAHRNMEKTAGRHGMFYDFKDIPKLLLFALCREYNNPVMRKRWNRVRDMLTRIYWRGEPLLVQLPEVECGHIDARRLGPFNRHEMEAWSVSRHVLENAAKIDPLLVQREDTRQALQRKLNIEAERANVPARSVFEEELPTHPDRLPKPSSRGAVLIDPKAFLGTLHELPIQVSCHIHMRFNRSNGRTISLEQVEIASGRAFWRRRKPPQPARRRARVRNTVLRCIEQGTFARRRDRDTHEDLPVLVRATRGTRHATFRVMFAPPPGG